MIFLTEKVNFGAFRAPVWTMILAAIALVLAAAALGFAWKIKAKNRRLAQGIKSAGNRNLTQKEPGDVQEIATQLECIRSEDSLGREGVFLQTIFNIISSSQEFKEEFADQEALETFIEKEYGENSYADITSDETELRKIKALAFANNKLAMANYELSQKPSAFKGVEVPYSRTGGFQLEANRLIARKLQYAEHVSKPAWGLSDGAWVRQVDMPLSNTAKVVQDEKVETRYSAFKEEFPISVEDITKISDRRNPDDGALRDNPLIRATLSLEARLRDGDLEITNNANHLFERICFLAYRIHELLNPECSEVDLDGKKGKDVLPMKSCLDMMRLMGCIDRLDHKYVDLSDSPLERSFNLVTKVFEIARRLNSELNEQMILLDDNLLYAMSGQRVKHQDKQVAVRGSSRIGHADWLQLSRDNIHPALIQHKETGHKHRSLLGAPYVQFQMDTQKEPFTEEEKTTVIDALGKQQYSAELVGKIEAVMNGDRVELPYSKERERGERNFVLIGQRGNMFNLNLNHDLENKLKRALYSPANNISDSQIGKLKTKIANNNEKARAAGLPSIDVERWKEVYSQTNVSNRRGVLPGKKPLHAGSELGVGREGYTTRLVSLSKDFSVANNFRKLSNRGDDGSIAVFFVNKYLDTTTFSNTSEQEVATHELKEENFFFAFGFRGGSVDGAGISINPLYKDLYTEMSFYCRAYATSRASGAYDRMRKTLEKEKPAVWSIFDQFHTHFRQNPDDVPKSYTYKGKAFPISPQLLEFFGSREVSIPSCEKSDIESPHDVARLQLEKTTAFLDHMLDMQIEAEKRLGNARLRNGTKVNVTVIEHAPYQTGGTLQL